MSIKTKYSVFLISTLLFGLTTSVCAEENILNAEYRYDGLQDSLTVSGTVEADKGNIPLTLELYGPDNKFILGKQTIAPSDSFKRHLNYSFEPIYYGVDFKSGIYTIEVSGYKVNNPVTLTYEYFGVDSLFEALGKVNKEIIDKNANGVFNAVKDNALRLGVSAEDIAGMGSEGIKVFSQLILESKLDIPETINSTENMEKVKSTAVEFRRRYADSAAIGKFNDIKTSLDFSNWIKKYSEQYAFSTDDKTTETNEEKLYQYTMKVSEDVSFISRIDSRTQLNNIKSIRDAVYEDSLLTVIEKNHYSETKEIMDTFPELFKVNTTKYSRLSPTNKGKVYEKVSGKHYLNYAEVADAFDKAVDDLLDEPTGGSPSGGGNSKGNSGSDWGKDGTSGVGVLPGKTQNVVNEYFSDLDNVVWAKEAITKLKEKNIIAGKSENIFSPNDYVTRAEFIKMVISAVGEELTDESADFNDVESDKWYYSYVNTAYKAGIVNGDNNNNFNPNERITRQDMAVILYRAYGINDEENSADFNDMYEISEYAVLAVNYFYSKGIISGMGNGNFEPKENATRAQAAVMLFNALTRL